MAITEKLFGVHFSLRLEPVIYGITERMAADYHGGYWELWTLSNGGFYMAPSGDRRNHVICQNQFEGDLSADALGITSCLSPTATSPGVCTSLSPAAGVHGRAP